MGKNKGEGEEEEKKKKNVDARVSRTANDMEMALPGTRRRHPNARCDGNASSAEADLVAATGSTASAVESTRPQEMAARLKGGKNKPSIFKPLRFQSCHVLLKTLFICFFFSFVAILLYSL